MADKKDQPADLTAEQLLEKRVDAFMEPASAPPLPGKAKTPAPSVVEKIADKPVAATPQPEADALPAGITVDPTNIDTPESDAAIADIVAQEADTVLAADDAGVATAQEEAEANEPPKPHGHPVFWFVITLVAILAVIAAAVLVNPNLLP